ncbi:MAG: ribosomal L7Ae/L30e/S12e/Gadd45 family protein [Lachnospiraceae bacterium]|nr:ribosomal L7Ae/L30e/S12e/Gadd45 family protein [Lachnospiraceae bacterium]
MKNDPVSGLLSLCAAGRNLVSGEFSVEKAIKEGRASVVILAADASDNTKKAFSDSCSYRKIPLFIYGTKESLGHAIGKEERASVAITDEGLSKGIVEKLRLSEEANGGNK